jgi:hypothetical protein
MTPWIESAHCASRAHCFECRNNRAFRASIVRAGLAPEPDFACPIGIAIGSVSIPRPGSGPGSILKAMLARLRITAGAECACNARVLEMDRCGPDWCERNIDTIDGWLAEEAARRGLPFNSLVARFLIRAAIAKSRRLARASL